MRISIFLTLASLVGVACGSAAELASPDGRVVVDFELGADGVPSYTISRSGAVVLAESRLGVVREDADFSRGLVLVDESRSRRVTDRYETPTAKRKEITYRANRKTFRLAPKVGGEAMEIVFQVSNDGVAFRYVFPDASATPRVLREEATSFRFPADSRAWLQPMSPAKSGWARTNPSYEEYYEKDIVVGASSPLGAGWVFPALFRSGETWVLVSETGLGRGYCASRLRHESPGGEYRIGFPDARETMGGEPVEPRFVTPYATPWRVIALGELGTVVESTLGTDLADAPAKGAPEGVPGAASWSWPKLGDSRTNYATSYHFIDYAAEMGWRYCLIDALWDTQIGDEKMRSLADHARSKNVALILWYNSNGDWNDAFQTPKNRLLTREGRQAEFAKLQALGVKGIKVDFFGGDGRAFVDLYHDLLQDSAPYGLSVNFHGATLSRGWQRTYPHLLTVEAVRGYEFITFGQDAADRAPSHLAMLPFARNVFDPMDFTPLCLEGPGKINRRTTVGAELATTVLFTSGVQHYVEIPEVLAKQPDYVKTFLREVPARWEESRFLTGYPGKLAVMARRGADGRWWIAGLNGEATAKTVEVSLAGLVSRRTKRVELIGDAAAGGFEKRSVSLGADRMLRVELAPHGGFSAVVK
jgi:hypothetical protein